MSEDLDREIAAARRRLEELEKLKRGQPPATTPPPIVQQAGWFPAETPDERSARMRGVWLLVALVVIAGFLIGVFSLVQRAPPADRVPLAGGGTVAAEMVKPLDTGIPGPTRIPWRYTVTADDMTDGKVRQACVWSTNKVMLGFPYGDRTGELCLRRHPRFGLDVILSLDGSGQFVCHDCRLGVRYDGTRMVRVSTAEPADHSSNVLFLLGEAAMIEQLKRTQNLRITAPYYEAGEQMLEFDVRGLEWPVKDPASEPAGDAEQ